MGYIKPEHFTYINDNVKKLREFAQEFVNKTFCSVVGNEQKIKEIYPEIIKYKDLIPSTI